MSIQRAQTGFALLIFMLVLLGTSIFALSKVLNKSINQQTQEKKVDSIKRLNDAKKALLSYSVEYLKGGSSISDMGKLPCPDRGMNGFGAQDANCGGFRRNAIGYLPYKALGLGKTEDSFGECFWYVVSAYYKENLNLGFLNEDSMGFLNVVDENNVLQHGNNPEDFPVALIISPGKNIGANRVQRGTADCAPDYMVTNYLEGGPNINYNPVVANNYDNNLAIPNDAIWTFLQPSADSQNNNSPYNDRIVAIYRGELWAEVRKSGALSFDNAATPPPPLPIPPLSQIESLTRSLAECIAAYGNTDGGANLLLPHPSVVDLDIANNTMGEYSNNANYLSNFAASLVGRFPQNLNNAVPNSATFVSNPNPVNSYCATPGLGAPVFGVTPYNQNFWENWKDSFFYLVSTDFRSTSGVLGDATKCVAGGGCATVNNNVDKVAAMVVFSGPSVALNAAPRRWQWDGVGAAIIDTKSQLTNYLEGDNGTPYIVNQVKNYNILNQTTDYSYCIEYINAFQPRPFRAIKCNDMDNNNATL